MPSIYDILPMPADLAELPPPDPFYHVIGSDGLLVMKRTNFGTALVPVASIDHLPKVKSYWWTDIPKIPADLINEVWDFFAWAHRTHDAEAMVYLLYHNDEYIVHVPDQEVTGTSVEATLKDDEIPADHMVIGTIHSHCDFDAYHSATDRKDAANHDGIHLTIGEVYKNPPEIAAMVAINGIVWDIELDECIEGELDETADHPTAWHDHVTRPKPRPIHRPWTASDKLDYLGLSTSEGSWVTVAGPYGTGKYTKGVVQSAYTRTTDEDTDLKTFRYVTDLLDEAEFEGDEPYYELQYIAPSLDREIDELLATLESIGINADLRLNLH